MTKKDMTAANEEQLIERVVDFTLNRHPALMGIIRPFSDILKEKARLKERFRHDPAWSNPDLASIYPQPVLTGMDFGPFRNHLKEAFDSMAAAVSLSIPVMSQPISEICDAAATGGIDITELAGSYIKKGSEGFDAAASAGVPADCLDLIVRLALSAVLETIESSAAFFSESIRGGGYCPLCGFPPSISYLDRAPENQSEFLKGGGGLKHLHCSLCGRNWQTSRHVCPVCGTDDPDMRFYLRVEDIPGERVDICQKCNTYLPCIDLRIAGPIQHLETAALGMVHLDLLAQEKGYNPVTRTPWNKTA